MGGVGGRLADCCRGAKRREQYRSLGQDGEEVDLDEHGLSYVGSAAKHALQGFHWTHKGECWNISHGRVVGEIAQSPPKAYWGRREIEPKDTHSDFLPNTMLGVLSRAQEWVDVTSLSPPDGKFLDAFAEAIRQLAERSIARGSWITIRLLFGNIIGMPVDCDQMIELLTANLPEESMIELWVGAWRKGVSWNHSKIIAVDGKYLFTGGHNLWDPHYLQGDPVHDVSLEAEGQVANDGHTFANAMWRFIIQTDQDLCCVMRCIPDRIPCISKTRVGVAQWPEDSSDYPPMFTPKTKPMRIKEAKLHGELPMITCGRYGALHAFPPTANPSDTAITEMIRSAQTIVRMSLQDLGPLTMPLPGNVLQAIPGGVWPDAYLEALAEGIIERGVDVEIVLSNPHAVPGGLSPMTANYGNGWSCVDVAAEIIKAILRINPDVDHAVLRKLVNENLRVTFIKSCRGTGGKWPDGETLGNHAKFFIVDDICHYIGSQNLYIANLAEWGVIVDDPTHTRRVLEDYWKPMWEQSYSPDDCNDDEVMDGLDVDRAGEALDGASPEARAWAADAERLSYNAGHNPGYYMTDYSELHEHHRWDQDTARAFTNMDSARGS